MNITTNDAFPATEIPGYGEIQRQIHEALRAEHPEWVQPNGDSPTCDFYESRFAELLRILGRTRSQKVRQDSQFLRRKFGAIAENTKNAFQPEYECNN